MANKAARLEAIAEQMRELRIKSKEDWEGAHGDADGLLIETIQVLTSGTSHRIVVGEILAEYGHPDFWKWYS